MGAQTRLSDFTEYRTKEDMQLTELGTIKVRDSQFIKVFSFASVFNFRHRLRFLARPPLFHASHLGERARGGMEATVRGKRYALEWPRASQREREGPFASFHSRPVHAHPSHCLTEPCLCAVPEVHTRQRSSLYLRDSGVNRVCCVGGEYVVAAGANGFTAASARI